MAKLFSNSVDPNPDSSFCGVWSESALFANYPKMGYEMMKVCISVATDDRL